MIEWRDYKIEDIATVVDCEHKTAPLVEASEYISVRTSNIAYGKVDFEKANRVSHETYEEWTKRLRPDEGDIVLAREAPVGEVGWIPKGRKVCLGQRTVLIRANRSINNPRYLLYYFANRETKYDLISRSTGSVVEHLNVKDIKHFDIRVHADFEIQNSIAEILSSLDDKIDLLHRQNKTLEQLAETLFRQWFVEEAEDDNVKLGEVVKTSSGGTPSRAKMEYYFNGTIEWVKSKELQGSFIFETEEKVTDDAVKNSSAKLFPVNTILIAMYGATVGEYGILAEPATCNQAICALIPNENYPYTFLFILTKLNKENLINMAGGSAQQNISQELIQELEIPKSKERIKEFHAEVEPMFQKIKSNTTQIRTLTQLRNTLLPKLMSGEVMVNLDSNDKEK